MAFHTFQVCVQPQILLAPFFCSTHNFNIFSTYLSLQVLEGNQKREFEIICGDRSEIYKSEIQIVVFDVIMGKSLCLHKCILKLLIAV